jgi:methionine synthase I (cobalamin-dependent)
MPGNAPMLGNRFLDLLATKPVLFADGGMGTSLFARGLETGDCPELWNVERPEQVADVHRSFAAAGADILLTNTFGGNGRRLALHGAQARVRELCVAGARIAREVADSFDRPIAVAGSMGPTGDIYHPVGPLSAAEGIAAFREQAEALAEGGVDVLWIETISAAEEITAALEAAAGVGLPVVSTMTFDTNGRTMMGLTPAAAHAHGHAGPCRPTAFGANCGIGPAQLVDSILGLVHAVDAQEIIVAKGNCGIPQYREGRIVYDGTPEVMADYAVLVRDAGARIIGGCCGTGPEHIRAMVAAVAARPRGPMPDAETVKRLLGPIATPTRNVGDVGERGERRRRRTAS